MGSNRTILIKWPSQQQEDLCAGCCLQNFTELFDGWHAAIYVTDFSGAFRCMEAADNIFTEHAFFDADISGLRDAQKYHQFRFQVSFAS